MLVIGDLQIISHKQFIAIFMTHHHSKYHIPRSNGPSLITIKLKAKLKFRTTAMLLFYIIQNSYINKRSKFFEDLLPHMISGSYIK